MAGGELVPNSFRASSPFELTQVHLYYYNLYTCRCRKTAKANIYIGVHGWQIYIGVHACMSCYGCEGGN